MTLRELDDLLDGWNDRLATAARNLAELQAESTYQLLSGSEGLPKVQTTGATAAQIEPALALLPVVYECFDLLKTTTDRAIALRQDLKGFGAEQRFREIENLLLTRSIRVPATGGLTSPEELMQFMASTFAKTHDAIAAVRERWDHLATELDRSEAQAAALRARLTARRGVAAELDLVERDLRAIRPQVQSDPFGATVQFESQVRSVLDRLQKEADEDERLRLQVEGALTSARASLEEIDRAYAEAVEVSAEARLKIADRPTLADAAPIDQVKGLRERLARLAAGTSGPLDPVLAGLRNWNSAAEDFVTEQRAVSEANRGALEERNELRGRLEALKAKARAYGVAENEDLTALGCEAEKLLYARPTPLNSATHAVDTYARTLRALGRDRSGERRGERQ